MLVLSNGPGKRAQTDLWHSDMTWRKEPSLGSILRAIEVPDAGGDTLFSDMGAAFRGLSPAMQDWLRLLEAEHSFAKGFGEKGGETMRAMEERFPPVTHPVVRTHSDTGEQALYVNIAFISRINGLSARESDTIAGDRPFYSDERA